MKSMISAPLLGECCFNCQLNLGSPPPDGARGKNARVFPKLVTHPRNLPSNLSGLAGKILAGIFLGLSVAHAEDRPKVPDYVPIVVDQVQYQAAMSYLGGLKFNDAAPVVKWLNELEERAKGQWEADHQPKPAEPPK